MSDIQTKEYPERENKMGTMPVPKLLITMSLPMMISMPVQALYNIVDSMFVAQLSEDALTAVSLAFPIQTLMIAVASGTGVGINALLSRNLGEKNFEGADSAAKNGLFLGIASCIVFAVVGLLGSHFFFALQTDNQTIVNRYKETRRMHPLQKKGESVEQAIRREREWMQPVRDHADFVLDTSALSIAKLRSELLDLFGQQGDRGGLAVNVLSFGFKHGIPIEADLVFDVRFMPNPYYVPELKNKTGLDQAVRDFVFSFRQTNDFMEQLEKMLTFLLPLYAEEGKSALVIAIGCTGGHHRSVAVAHELAEYITEEGYQVTENHRDISR